eukprot:11756118-Alexandrium_andersonii.AAC.1
MPGRKPSEPVARGRPGQGTGCEAAAKRLALPEGGPSGGRGAKRPGCAVWCCTQRVALPAWSTFS